MNYVSNELITYDNSEIVKSIPKKEEIMIWFKEF